MLNVEKTVLKLNKNEKFYEFWLQYLSQNVDVFNGNIISVLLGRD